MGRGRRARRAAVASKPGGVGAQTEGGQAVAVRGLLAQPRPHGAGGGLGFIDDAHDLDVGIAERDDAVAGAVADVPAARQRGQSQVTFEARGRRFDVPRSEDDVVDGEGCHGADGREFPRVRRSRLRRRPGSVRIKV